jgi:hypothetical protein
VTCGNEPETSRARASPARVQNPVRERGSASVPVRRREPASLPGRPAARAANVPFRAAGLCPSQEASFAPGGSAWYLSSVHNGLGQRRASRGPATGVDTSNLPSQGWAGCSEGARRRSGMRHREGTLQLTGWTIQPVPSLTARNKPIPGASYSRPEPGAHSRDGLSRGIGTGGRSAVSPAACPRWMRPALARSRAGSPSGSRARASPLEAPAAPARLGAPTAPA